MDVVHINFVVIHLDSLMVFYLSLFFSLQEKYQLQVVITLNIQCNTMYNTYKYVTKDKIKHTCADVPYLRLHDTFVQSHSSSSLSSSCKCILIKTSLHIRPKFLYNLVYGFFGLKCPLGGRKIKINIILLSNLLYFYGKSLHSVDRK